MTTPTELTEYSDSSASTATMSLATAVADKSPTADDRTLPRRPWRRRPTPWAALVGHQYKGSGTEEDPYVVTFLGTQVDTECPQAYGFGYKWWITIIAATGTLAVTMGSSILSAAIAPIKAEFPGHTAMEYSFVTGAYILGFVLGPFIWAPSSEVFGRRAVYVWTLPLLTAFDAAVCGAKSLAAMLVLRFIAGTFGCSTMTNAGGIISDMFEADQRGLAMGVFGAMPWLGPVIGPLIGGFLSEKASWRWVEGVTALFAALMAVVHILFLPETYAPLVLRQRADRLSEATGKVYRSQADVSRPFDIRELIKHQFKVPYILLFTEPIVFFLSLYMAIVFGILYMQFTAFPIVFTGMRHWSPGVSALAFIGMSVGTNLALLWMIFWGNPAYAKLLRAKGYLPPEARLPMGITGAIMMPIGLIIFAWTCYPVTIHWIVPLLATVPYGAGMVLVFLACQNYLVDAYLPTAASVIAGGTVVRSIVGAVLPLFTQKMYESMGVNWAASLAAFIAFAFVPVPLLLVMYGHRIRRWTKYGREADDHAELLAASKAEQIAAAAAATTGGHADAEGKLPGDLTKDEELALGLGLAGGIEDQMPELRSIRSVKSEVEERADQHRAAVV